MDSTYPGTSKEEDVDADECDQHLVAGLIVWVCGANGSNDDLSDRHADGAEHEERASSPFLN
jgi:hypothetical protein